MRGFCGVVAAGPADLASTLRSMLASLPVAASQASNHWHDREIALGVVATRDDALGRDRQPGALDARFRIVADARIDDQGRLRSELIAAGEHPAENCADHDLILHAYRAWGRSCLQHLLGDFSFAIWDHEAQELFCARDQLGIKPMFYASCDEGRRLAFANCLETLAAAPGVSRDLDDNWIANYLLFESSDDPTSTPYAAIRRISPGHWLAWKQGAIETASYWQVPKPSLRYRPAKAVVDEFLALLGEAVADRIRGNDVDVELSGGLDSTLVAAMAVSQLRPRGGTVQAHTISYHPLTPDLEPQFARQVADHLGIESIVHHGDEMPLFHRIKEGRSPGPEPLMDPYSALNESLVRHVRNGQGVVLTGWDGDALLNDSPKAHFMAQLRRGEWLRLCRGLVSYAWGKRRAVPRFILARSRRLLGKSGEAPSFPVWIEPELERRLGLRDRWRTWFEQAPTAPAGERPHAVEAMRDICEQPAFFGTFEEAQTGYPVEYRHPLLDLRVLEFCLALPPWPWCASKELLRRAGRGFLPESVRTRPKTGLAGQPLAELLARQGADWIDGFVAFDGLSRYLIRDQIPRLRPAAEPRELWRTLRPFSLNAWLRSSQANSQGTDR